MNKLMCVVAAVGLTCAAAHGQRQTSTSPLSFTNLSGPSQIDGAAYATSFEAPTFAVGNLNGQDGWTVFAASPSNPQVSTAIPSNGLQHLRLQKDTATASGNLIGGFSPNIGAQPPLNAGEYWRMSVDVLNSELNGADMHIIPQAPSQGFLSARVRLDFSGSIFVLDNTGGVLTFVNTNVPWTVGQYGNVAIELDTTGVRYFYNNSLIHSTAVIAGTSFEQVVLASDNFYSPNGFGAYDNLSFSVVPAPGSLALLGMGGLFMARRRR